MKKLLLLFVTILYFSFSGNSQTACETLFISEYAEGWSNNKAIELYNPTDQAIDLSDYRLDRYSNGSSSAGPLYKLRLNGVMPPLSVYVIVLDKRDPEGTGQEAPVWDELQAKADTFACPVYDENRVMYFNGNDAMVLVNDASGGAGFIWDVIGVIGQDPGNPSDGGGWNNVPPDYTWAANGEEAWTANHSLIRKPDVVSGVFSPPPAGEWDVSVQWDSIPPVVYNEDGIVTGGNWASLGQHICDCGDVISGISSVDFINFDIFPNPVSNTLKINSEVAVDRIDVYDLTGKQILSISGLNKKEIELNSEDWNKGMFLINLRFENNVVITKKVLKQ